MTAKIQLTELMDNIFTKSLSLSLFTMPALVLTVHHGVSISAIPILVLSLIVLKYSYPVKIRLNKKEKILIFSLLLLPLIMALDVILRDLRLRYVDYYLRFVFVLPVFFALRKVRVNLTPLVMGILIGSIGAGVFALYQNYYLDHSLSEYSSLGYMIKINFGNISLLLGMMSLAGLFLVKGIPFKKIYIVISIFAFLLGITGSILSGSRGGWLAIPFFIGLFFIYFPGSRKFKIFSVISLILGILVIYYSNSYVKSRIDLAYTNTETYFSTNQLTATKTSTGTRLELWKAGWMIVQTHPLLGIGSGQFKQVLEEKIDAGKIKEIELYSHVHNESLQILISTGIAGFLAYLILYAGSIYFFYSSLKESNSNKVSYLSFMGIMTIGAYFIFGLTNYSFGHHVMVLFLAVMIAIFSGAISSIENTKNT